MWNFREYNKNSAINDSSSNRTIESGENAVLIEMQLDLYGWKFGFLINPHDISITELEDIRKSWKFNLALLYMCPIFGA